MHRKYASNGLVCMSVSLDLPEDRAAALAFLQKQDARFPNFWLNEDQQDAFEKLNVDAQPVAFVFDQEGKYIKFDFTNPDQPVTYADMEKTVRQLLGLEP